MNLCLFYGHCEPLDRGQLLVLQHQDGYFMSGSWAIRVFPSTTLGVSLIVNLLIVNHCRVNWILDSNSINTGPLTNQWHVIHFTAVATQRCHISIMLLMGWWATGHHVVLKFLIKLDCPKEDWCSVFFLFISWHWHSVLSKWSKFNNLPKLLLVPAVMPSLC